MFSCSANVEVFTCVLSEFQVCEIVESCFSDILLVVTAVLSCNLQMSVKQTLWNLVFLSEPLTSGLLQLETGVADQTSQLSDQ